MGLSTESAVDGPSTDPVQQAARPLAVPAVGVEAGCVAVRTGISNLTSALGDEAAARQVDVDEPTEIEHPVLPTSGAGCSIEVVSEAPAERLDHRKVDLIAAGPDVGPDNPNQVGSYACQPLQPCDTGLDDAGRQAPPARVNGGHGAAVLGCQQDRNTVGSQNSHGGCVVVRQDCIGLGWRRDTLSGARDHDAVNLSGPHDSVRRPGVTCAEAMTHADVLEQRMTQLSHASSDSA